MERLDRLIAPSYAAVMRLPATRSDNQAAALREFVAAVRTLLGAELKEARLFGSRARAASVMSTLISMSP
jgi:hypothetical protein